MPSKNSIGTNIPIEISKGGTNATSFSTSNGISRYDGTSMIASTSAIMDVSNRMTNAEQPAFLANLSATVNDVTGDGSTYRIICDAEIYDQGNDFSTVTGDFTAPIAGRYLFSVSIKFEGIGASNGASRVRIVTSDKTYSSSYLKPNKVKDSNSCLKSDVTVLASMDAADNVFFSLQVYSSPKEIDVIGDNATFYTHFSGYLVC